MDSLIEMFEKLRDAVLNVVVLNIELYPSSEMFHELEEQRKRNDLLIYG